MLDSVTSASLTEGIGHVVLSVDDLGKARDFYGALGLVEDPGVRWPACGEHAVFPLDDGQFLVVAEGPVPEDRPQSAAHVGLVMAPDARARIAGSGLAVAEYREDNPAEAEDNFYVVDTAGNRLQLLARNRSGVAIDHVAIEVSDIMWAQYFYGDGMGWALHHRVGWSTEDYLKAKAKGEAGMKDAMPGSRYINERYSQFEKERRAVRPNPQLYQDAGAGCMVATYLAARHYKAPPDDQRIGVPRLGLRAVVGLEHIVETLEKLRMPYEGPVAHPQGTPVERSLFIRDQGGNFVEFTSGV
jgi:catechol 2,3-dioxygenase-like lactoylglutathione lyase family enzyme